MAKKDPHLFLQEKLSQAKLDGWQIWEEKKTSHQTFLAMAERECLRTVDTTVYTILVLKERDEKERGRVLGLSRFKITPGQISNAEKLIEDAALRSSLVSNQPFSLPEKPKNIPDVPVADPNAGEGALADLENRVKKAASREAETRLSTTEFFIDRIRGRLTNHKGLNLEEEETKLHMELILLSSAGGTEKEYINRYTRRFLKDFDVEGELKHSARLAREATRAGLPKTGRFPVLFSEEPLDGLFDPVVARATGSMKYNRIVQSEQGQSVMEAEGEGTPVTVWSNPLIPGMVGSHRFDHYGTPGRKICLIENNKLRQYLADKRFADYMSLPVTGEMGNLEIEPGTTPFADLQKRASTSTPLYHITAFSAFEPNDVTGAFSAEIRSGYEITPEGSRPIKGGSVSGVLLKDLPHATFSRECVKRESVVCPQGVFFPSLSIGGE